MIPLHLARVVDEFWERAGGAGEFPRDIESAVMWALPLSIVHLSRLHATAVRSWLDGHRYSDPGRAREGGSGRPLCGCLAAFAGRGFAFVDGRDSPAEIRFTIAHEAAHFLIDYELPRERMIAALAAGGVEVFDRVRLPNTDERVHALLAGLDCDARTWLFDRDDTGASLCQAARDTERDADSVAFELLAPYESVMSALADAPAHAGEGDHAGVARMLESRFGLPPQAASLYARRVVAERSSRAGGSIVAWLGLGVR